MCYCPKARAIRNIYEKRVKNVLIFETLMPNKGTTNHENIELSTPTPPVRLSSRRSPPPSGDCVAILKRPKDSKDGTDRRVRKL